jgi:hypothetical protein
MGVTHCNFKIIVKGSECYHQKQWNVATPVCPV